MGFIKERTVKIDTAASGDTTLVAAETGSFIRVMHVAFVTKEAVDVKFKSGASTDITGLLGMGIGGVFVDQVSDPGRCLFKTAESEALIINLSAAKQVGGYCYVQIVPKTPI